MFVGCHVYAFATELNAFLLQPEALLMGSISAQLDLTAR